MRRRWSRLALLESGPVGRGEPHRDVDLAALRVVLLAALLAPAAADTAEADADHSRVSAIYSRSR